MTRFDSKGLIDSVELVELHVDPVGSRPDIKRALVKYALANTKTGTLYGSGTFFSWSDEVSEKLNELMRLMEREIGAHIFPNENEAPSSSVEDEVPPLEDDVPGL